ncbi:hypothetical protein Taro_010193 [Colocasia esculenta]|uniref:Uncharacterized protein n=1 Tax=Colocasia esculenta TaxID=4460 RepID=A0A843U7M1_COLES|nr:hypothetical protein [Colocasia esculenta]
MRGECPELKKKLKKEKFTFMKAKAMLATWSYEDEDEDAQATSGDEEIQCLMARSDDSNEATSVDTTWASVDTLSQIAQKVFWELSLVSTLLDPVSTLLDQFFMFLLCVRSDYEVQEEEQVEDGNASE